MRYELWLSLRYLLAKRRGWFVSLIAVLSIIGVALGVATLIIVLSVMSGFDADITDKLVGANAHLIVGTEQGLSEDQVEPLMRQIAATDHVVGVSPFLIGQAILRLPDQALGVTVRGLDTEREVRVSRLQEYLVMGHLPTHEHEVVIGSELARYMGVGPGGPLSLISPADGALHELTISGIFRS